MDDKQLMAQIAAGDQAALQTLLRRHGPLLQYILKPILTDPREREECLADISLRLWQRAGDYAPERGQFVPWLNWQGLRIFLPNLWAATTKSILFVQPSPVCPK